MKLCIVTPVGGSALDARQTIMSVCLVAKAHSEYIFEHVLVLNNGAELHPNETPDIPRNLSITIEDLNPIANRSAARNHGVSMLSSNDGFVLFLDSGDLLLPYGLNRLCERHDAVHAFSAAVLSAHFSFVRTPKSQRLIELINPYYIGAMWVPIKYAQSYPFPNGRKEDWKVWVALSRARIPIIYHEECNYIYTVKSRLSHASRKAKLFHEQLDFFRNFLGKSKIRSAISIMGHYSIQAYLWFGRRKSQECPSSIQDWHNKILKACLA